MLKKEYQHLCIHHLEVENGFEQNLIMLSWFEKFITSFENSTRSKVSKPAVFKSFVSMIIEEPTFAPMLKALREFIIDNNLIH